MAKVKTEPNSKEKNFHSSGPSGPIDIEKARDWEVEFKNGIPYLARLDVKIKNKRMTDTGPGKGKGGVFQNDTGTIPAMPPDLYSMDDFGWPFGGENRPSRIAPKEENVMGFIERIEAKAPMIFKDFLFVVKSLFPQIKMVFPQPPTYVWNPKEKKEGEEPAPLNPKAIKDKLKVRFPDLVWASTFEGIDTSTVEFGDGGKVELSIGLDANHLTLTYYPAKKVPADKNLKELIQN